MKSVIFRLYSKHIVKPIYWFDNFFGIKSKYHRLRCFLAFFLNMKNTRCPFSEFVLSEVVCLPHRDAAIVMAHYGTNPCKIKVSTTILRFSVFLFA